MRVLEPLEQREAEVAGALVRFYAKCGVQVVRFSDKRRARTAVRGWPDLVCFCPAKHQVWLHEVKAPRGRQSVAQTTLQQLAESCDMAYLCGGVGAAHAHLVTIGVLEP